MLEAEWLEYCRNITHILPVSSQETSKNQITADSNLKSALCACVRACTVRARRDACARRRRSRARTVQQAQAAGRAGEAAKNAHKSSSRCLKLRGAQRERRNFGVHGKSRPGASLPLSVWKKRRFGCSWRFFPLFSFRRFLSRGAGAHAARNTSGREDKRSERIDGKLKKKTRQKSADLDDLWVLHINSSTFLFPSVKMCTSSEKGCVQCGGTGAPTLRRSSAFFTLLLNWEASARALYCLAIALNRFMIGCLI